MIFTETLQFQFSCSNQLDLEINFQGVALGLSFHQTNNLFAVVTQYQLQPYDLTDLSIKFSNLCLILSDFNS